MKVIRDGQVARRHAWWHGEQVGCFCCGRVVVLEPGDEAARDQVSFEPRANGRTPEWVCVHCPCGGRPTLTQSQARVRALRGPEKLLNAAGGRS